MRSDRPFLDDMAKVAQSALGSMTSLRQEIESFMHSQLEKLLHRMNLVKREEFEAVQAMVAKARAEQEILAERLSHLESVLKRDGVKDKSSPHAHKNKKE